MARGNQREKAREANQKKMAQQVSPARLPRRRGPECSLPSPTSDLPPTVRRPDGSASKPSPRTRPDWPHGGREGRFGAHIKKGQTTKPYSVPFVAALPPSQERGTSGDCVYLLTRPAFLPALQKSKNDKSGFEMQREKEAVAAKMREKQKLGRPGATPPPPTTPARG